MPEDSYIPGKGKTLKELEEAEANNNNNETEFIVDENTGNLKTAITPNWIADTQKAINIMNDETGDQPLPGGFAPEDSVPKEVLTEEERQAKLKAFEAEEKNVQKLTLKGNEINQYAPLSTDAGLLIYNKCDNKKGIYCQTFKDMLSESTRCVFIEMWGDKKMWTMWVLRSPELENMHHIDYNNVEAMTKARFNIPFKTIRVLLKNCPDCGGDLSF